MNILDDIRQIKKLDKSNVLESIDSFPQQCLQALNEIEKLNIPSWENKVKNIVVCGMGGSAFAPEIIKTLFSQEIKLPYEIVRNYNLPFYVNENSLVIASSYSGNTAETLSCAQGALKRKAQVMVLTNNGQLADLLKKEELHGYVFVEKHNPCHQPRVGAGYMVCGHLGLLIKSNLVKTSFEEIKKAIKNTKNVYQMSLGFEKNLAKKMAFKIKDKFVFLVTSEFLEGAIHGFANQLNETAKTNSVYHYIPELNHHRMEGLKYPLEFKKMAVFLFYPSLFYDKRNQVRYQITKRVIEKNDYQTLEFKSQALDKISQTFETIIFNSYLSFYLAILNKVDPSKIPWVDYFKAELKKLLPNDQ